MSDMFGEFLEDPEADFDHYDDISTDEDSLSVNAETLHEPKLMQTIAQHETVEQDLLKWYQSDRMPHALIFSGIKGIGKATMAYRIARFLLKEGAEELAGESLFGDAPLPSENLNISSDHNIFKKVASGGHPDMMVIERQFDDKKNRLKAGLEVDQIRKVAPFMRMTASSGKWRIVIIDDADTMNRNSQNGILKILEEPPENSLIILVTHNLGSLIPTIRSRCRLVNFHPLDTQTVTSLLKKGLNDDLPSNEKDMLAKLAEGSIGRAMEYALEENISTLRKLAEIINEWPNQGKHFNRLDIFALSELVSQNGKEHAFQTMQQSLNWLLGKMTRACITGTLELPPPYDETKLLQRTKHNSLASWVEICDKLKEHFINADKGNLDKRQITLDAFRILEQTV